MSKKLLNCALATGLACGLAITGSMSPAHAADANTTESSSTKLSKLYDDNRPNPLPLYGDDATHIAEKVDGSVMGALGSSEATDMDATTMRLALEHGVTTKEQAHVCAVYMGLEKDDSFFIYKNDPGVGERCSWKEITPADVERAKEESSSHPFVAGYVLLRRVLMFIPTTLAVVLDLVVNLFTGGK